MDKKLKEASEDYTKDFESPIIAALVRIGYEEGAEWQSTQSEWISVEKELPTEKQYGFYLCLIFRKDGEIRQAMFNTLTKQFQNMEYEVINDSVTHWQPLPSPPQDKSIN